MMIKTVNLGELISPAKVRRCNDGEYPVLSMTMHDGIVLQSERFKKSLASLDQSNYKVVSRGQLVVGFPIDEGVIYVQNAADEGIMSPAYGVWDIHAEKVLPEYLECCLHSPQSMSYYLSKLKGTTARRRSITTEDLLSLPISQPDKSEQRRRLSLLSSCKDTISKSEQQLAKLDELVKARFIELFGDPVQNPMGWKIETLKKATTKIGSGATPKGGKESYQTEGITLIRSMNVHDGRFEYKDLAHITDEQAKQLENSTVKENDVFINITGASVARSCIVPKHILPARVNQHVAIIRCITSMLHPVFANQMFLNTSFKGQLLDIGESGGATRQAITKQQLETLDIILPPLELQKQFAAFVEQTDKSKLAVQQSLEKLETLKKSLMQQYFG